MMSILEETPVQESRPDDLLWSCMSHAIRWGAALGAVYGGLVGTGIFPLLGTVFGLGVGGLLGLALGVATGVATYVAAVTTSTLTSSWRRVLFAAAAALAIGAVYLGLVLNGVMDGWTGQGIALMVLNPAVIATVGTYQYAPRVLSATPKASGGGWIAVWAVVAVFSLLAVYFGNYFGAPAQKSRELVGFRDQIVQEAGLPADYAAQANPPEKCYPTYPVSVSARWDAGMASSPKAADEVTRVLEARGYTVTATDAVHNLRTLRARHRDGKPDVEYTVQESNGATMLWVSQLC